jgi:hypothetical protein
MEPTPQPLSPKACHVVMDNVDWLYLRQELEEQDHRIITLSPLWDHNPHPNTDCLQEFDRAETEGQIYQVQSQEPDQSLRLFRVLPTE